jgi:hypothetical protein
LAEKDGDKKESETLLNLEKAETEESKNLRDDYTVAVQAEQAREAAQPETVTPTQ